MDGDLQTERTEFSSVDAGWIGELVERAWKKLGGKVPRERIGEIAGEAMARYSDARVNAFVPVLVERHLWEQLHAEVPRTKRSDETVLHVGPAHSAGGEPGAEGSLQRPEATGV